MLDCFAERVSWLYEQGASEGRIRDYVRHWQRWVTGGLGTRKLDREAWRHDYRGFRRALVFVPHEPGPQRL